jgi:hypothetical protein
VTGRHKQPEIRDRILDACADYALAVPALPETDDSERGSVAAQTVAHASKGLDEPVHLSLEIEC